MRLLWRTIINHCDKIFVVILPFFFFKWKNKTGERLIHIKGTTGWNWVCTNRIHTAFIWSSLSSPHRFLFLFYFPQTKVRQQPPRSLYFLPSLSFLPPVPIIYIMTETDAVKQQYTHTHRNTLMQEGIIKGSLVKHLGGFRAKIHMLTSTTERMNLFSFKYLKLWSLYTIW